MSKMDNPKVGALEDAEKELDEASFEETSGKTFDQVLFSAFVAGFLIGEDEFENNDTRPNSYLRDRFNEWRAQVINTATADDIPADSEGVESGVPDSEQSSVSAVGGAVGVTEEVGGRLVLRVAGPPQPAFKEPKKKKHKGKGKKKGGKK